MKNRNENLTTQPERIKGRKGLAAGAALVAALAIAGCSPTAEAEPRPTETTSSEAPAPVETSNPTPETPSEKLEIQAGLTADEFANTFFNKNLSVYETLQTDETIDELVEFSINGGELNDFINQKIDEVMPSFLENTFTNQFINNPENSDKIDGLAEQMGDALYFWQLTYESGDPADIEPYNKDYNVISTVELASNDQGRTIEITFQESDNRDMNRMGSQYVDIMPDYPVSLMTVSTVVESGVEKIDSYSFSR